MDTTMLTVKDVANWMEENGYDFISQDGNFVTIGHYDENGECIEDTQLM